MSTHSPAVANHRLIDAVWSFTPAYDEARIFGTDETVGPAEGMRERTKTYVEAGMSEKDAASKVRKLHPTSQADGPLVPGISLDRRTVTSISRLTANV